MQKLRQRERSRGRIDLGLIDYRVDFNASQGSWI